MEPRAEDQPGLAVGTVLGTALAWSWTAWAIAASTGGLSSAVGTAAWVLGGLGPLVAVAAALRRSDPAYRQRFRRRTVARPADRRWWLAVLAVGVGLKAVGLLAAAASGADIEPSDVALGLGVLVTVAYLVVSVWIEEPLWRGIALDAALSRASVTLAGLGIGVLWALWHVPLFLVEGTYQYGLSFGSAAFFAFLIAIVPNSVLLTVLVTSSGGAISLALVAHFLGNLAGELAPRPENPWIEVALTALAAGVVLAFLRPRGRG